jgi:2-polyprenyl-6-methoxyphenol hydroxylase-like FAD-dependent oxidoreductase
VSDRAIRHVPVVIVGAGPTGVTAATLLAQYGVDCLVLDRWHGVYPQPRAVHLDDEIYRIIARLGIAEEFAAISRPTHGLRLVDQRFKVLAEFTRDTSQSRNGFPQANMFDQPELEALLRTNLKRYPNAQLRGDTDVTAVVDHAGRMRVTFTDRRNGQRHQVDADYLLGCDGANSTVRAQIGSQILDLGFEQRWLVVDVATDTDLHQWEGVHQVCDPMRAATYMRIGSARYRWEFQLLAGESADDFATLAAVRPLIAPWTVDVPEGELTLVRVTQYTFRALVADRWRRGNTFILGDAAHLTPPFVGQGMGAGIRDAMNLAWKIAAVRNGTLSANVLESYEQERKPHTLQMIRLALNVGRAMTQGGRLGNLARRLVLPRLRLVPGLRDKVVDSTTPALHSSELVCKSSRPRQLAGTLCPNPLLPEGQRLDDRLGQGFALVTAGRPDAADQAALERSGVVVLVADPGSVLQRWLRRGGATAAIVRPDRTVLRAGHDVAALCAWTVSRLRRPGDDQRHSYGVQDTVADRAQHRGQAAAAMTADDDELRGL